MRNRELSEFNNPYLRLHIAFLEVLIFNSGVWFFYAIYILERDGYP